MPVGVKSTNVPLVTSVASLLGNSPEGSTGRILNADIARLLRATTPSYALQSELDADLDWPEGTEGRVYGDTAANNGVYRKLGVSGAGSWSRIGDNPGYEFVDAVANDTGTANALVATSTPNVLYSDGVQLIALTIYEDNTASAVTVAFDGGSAVTIKTAAGNAPAVGGLKAGMRVLGFIDANATVFQLLSDQASAAIQSAAEAAQTAAEAAASQIVVTKFNTQAEMKLASVAALAKSAELMGFYAAGDGGGALYIRMSLADIVSAGYPSAAYFKSADTYLPDGTQDSVNGGYWVIAEVPVNMRQLGAKGDGTTDDTAIFTTYYGMVDELIIPYGNFVISTTTIDKPIQFEKGAAFTVPSGQTVTFQEGIKSSEQTIFKGAGNVSLSLPAGDGRGDVAEAHASWWGIYPSLNIGNQGALLNKATQSFDPDREGILRFGNGVYATNQTIYVPRGLKIQGIGSRRTLFYPLSDGFSVFETQNDGAYFCGIQFESAATMRTSPCIKISHTNAFIDDVLFKNMANAIEVNAEGALIENVRYNHDAAFGAADSSLIKITVGRCTIDGVYGFFGKTYGPDSLIHIEPSAKMDGVIIRNINVASQPRVVKVVTGSYSITGLSITGIMYSGSPGTVPSNVIEFNVGAGTYVQGVNISDVNVNSFPSNGIYFDVENNGVLERINIDCINILGTTTTSTRTGIEFKIGAGATGAIRNIEIGKVRNIIRPASQDVVVPTDARVSVTVH